jgi:hypothetical protein
VDGLLTGFSYDSDGNRLLMSVAGVVTTYTLDYGNNRQILLEQGGAFATTKHYLYGLECIGELVDAGEPETEEWRYYQRDGNNLVRQTTNSQAEITLAWAYSPDGAVLIGAKGPVTNLGCGDIYDWSTGLVYKDGRYFDPNLGIWLTLAPFVVWQLYKPGKRGGKSRRKRRDRKQLFLLLLFLLVIALGLSGCNPPPDPTRMPTLEPTATPCPTPTLTPSNTPMPGLPTNTPTPVPPTNTPTPMPPAYTPTPTLTPVQSINSLNLANPFGAGKHYLVSAYYGYHLNKSGEPIGYQTNLGGGQGTGHPGVDVVPLQYALESKRNNYVPSPNHRDLFAPVSGIIAREPGKHRISILVQTLEGTLTIGLVHVDSNEASDLFPDGATVQAGQQLFMSFKGQGHGQGSAHPHLHLEMYTGDGGNAIYHNPLPALLRSSSNDYQGNYWTYIDPDDKKYFTQLPGPGD